MYVYMLSSYRLALENFIATSAISNNKILINSSFSTKTRQQEPTATTDSNTIASIRLNVRLELAKNEQSKKLPKLKKQYLKRNIHLLYMDYLN